MLSVKLQTFEGPLDLLLHLIEKNKVNIYDIPIVEITAQYMEYVSAMDKKDLDLVSDFLVMAATLLDIKSRMLLPAEVNEEGEEVDPREELVERLTEYKLYRSLAQDLAECQDDAERLFFRDPSIPKEVSSYEEPVDVEKLLSGLTLQKLQDIYRMVMKRQVDKLDPIRSKFGTITKDPVRLSEKLAFVFDYAETHGQFTFADLLRTRKSRADVIVTFLACLELIKIGRLSVEQEGTFAEIDLTWNADCATQITKEDMEQYD